MDSLLIPILQEMSSIGRKNFLENYLRTSQQEGNREKKGQARILPACLDVQLGHPPKMKTVDRQCNSCGESPRSMK